MDLQEQERSINDLELQIDRLRALYEQYFIGIEKLEPHIPRKRVERAIQALRRERINNTALRFRFQQLIQRYNTLQTYWRRVSRQIEEGTYRRDVLRARARAEQRREERAEQRREERTEQRHADSESEERLPSHEINLDEFDELKPEPPPPASPTVASPPTPSTAADAAHEPRPLEAPASRAVRVVPPPASSEARPPAPPPSPPKVRPPAPPPRQNHNLSQDRIHSLSREYISARQHCNQPTRGLTLEKVSQQIKRQEAALRNKHGKDVDFQVTIRDGKAILRAVRKN